MVAGNDKVGLAGNSALQDAVVGVISNNCQALLRMHLFREIFYLPNRTLRFGIIPQEFFLDYPFDLFENWWRDYIEDSFSPGQKNYPGWPGLGKVEGRNKNVGVDNHLKHLIVCRGLIRLLAGYPPPF